MTDKHVARCFCGAIEIEVTGPPLEMGYCHCSSCRAYSGGPFSSYLLFKSENVRVARGEAHLAGFNKMGMSDRQFCTRCGGHITTAHPTMGLTDVRAGALPDLPFVPTVHLNYAEAVMPVEDGLPKLRDFPAEAGGSGVLMPELRNTG